MRFWDASAIIPLLIDEPTRAPLLKVLGEDPEILAWWGTTVEIASALARREREQLLAAEEVEAALASVHQLADSWHEIVPSTGRRQLFLPLTTFILAGLEPSSLVHHRAV